MTGLSIFQTFLFLSLRHTRDKMASGATIRVCVLEGQYAQLSNLGFPVFLAVELQQGGLCLDNAKWSSCLSDAGFLVSFFWPIVRTTQRRQHRQRREPRTHPNSGNFRTNTIVTNQDHICPIPRKGTLVSLPPVLADAHPSFVATSVAVDAEVPLLREQRSVSVCWRASTPSCLIWVSPSPLQWSYSKVAFA